MLRRAAGGTARVAPGPAGARRCGLPDGWRTV